MIPQGENHFVTVQNDLKYRQKIDKDTKVHHKSIVISYYHKEITPDADKSISDGNENESQIQEDEAAAIYSGDSKEEIEKHQVEIDREQSIKDREQAEIDRIEAEKDQAEAEKARQQAIIDQKLAEKERIQARADQKRAQMDMKKRSVDKNNNLNN